MRVTFLHRPSVQALAINHHRGQIDVPEAIGPLAQTEIGRELAELRGTTNARIEQLERENHALAQRIEALLTQMRPYDLADCPRKRLGGV